MFQKVTDAFQEYYYLRLHNIHQFEPKIYLNYKIGSFRIKTADSINELKQSFQLRYEVYYKELKGSKKVAGCDIDQYDFHCDHLLIIDEKSNTVAGTYRLNSSQSCDKSYSAREFNIERIFATAGVKVELGRACIKKEYRRGVVISLLWKGIADYMSKIHAQLLFGCASFQVKTARQAALLHRYFFEERKYAPEYFSPPQLAYKMPDFEAWESHFKRSLTLEERIEAESLIPNICKDYLKLGSFFGGEPAWDEDFNCLDFLTILQREDLNRSLGQRHKTDS